MDYPYRLVKDNGEIFPYEKDIEEGSDDYFYRISAIWRKKDCEIIITRFGVSIDWDDGTCTTTNIEPMSLFPNAIWKLTKKQLLKIIDCVEKTGGEGMKYSIDELYEEWKRLGCP